MKKKTISCKKIRALISRMGGDEEDVGVCGSLCVQYDRTERAWRIYDDYYDAFVTSMAQAKKEIRQFLEG